MKKLKTIFVTIAVATTLLTVAGAASADEITLNQTKDQPVMTYIVADPGTGGGGGK